MNLLKLALITLKLCLVKVGEIKVLLKEQRRIKADLFLKILLIVPVTVPVTVPFVNANKVFKVLVINVVIKNIKLQLYRQLFFMVHLKKVLFQIEKSMFLGSVLKVQDGRFRENVICLLLVVDKLNFKRALREKFTYCI